MAAMEAAGATVALARGLHGNEAAKQAGMPYYQAAGEKMLEAKNQLDHGEFQPWLKRNFNLSYESARGYMKFAKAMEDQKTGIPVFSSLNDFHRQTGDSAYRSITTRRDWHEPVKADSRAANVISFFVICAILRGLFVVTVGKVFIFFVICAILRAKKA